MKFHFPTRTFILTASLAAMMAVSAYAYDVQGGTVTTSSAVNFRQEATTESESMGKLSSLEGVNVAAVFVMVDRKEKGQTEKGAMQEIEEQFGFPVYSVVDVYDIIEYLEEDETNAENVARIKNYLAVNGAK